LPKRTLAFCLSASWQGPGCRSYAEVAAAGELNAALRGWGGAGNKRGGRAGLPGLFAGAQRLSAAGAPGQQVAARRPPAGRARNPGHPALAAADGQAGLPLALGPRVQFPATVGGDQLDDERVHDSSLSFHVLFSLGKTRSDQPN
jgi:hypothetical protein